MSSHLVPLAETFHSIQGEGTFVGTPMHFIRVAGCPVGSRATRDWVEKGNGTHLLPILEDRSRGSMCQAYDGRFFVCDTNFHISTKRTVESLVNDTHEKHICLTGGEPLAYAKTDWMQELHDMCNDRDIDIHIETSGTIDVSNMTLFEFDWIAVAPKKAVLDAMIDRANEIKLLVDEHFSLANVPQKINARSKVFLSPINDEKEVNQMNVKICMSYLITHPTWRLSAQWHKFLGVR